MWWLMLAGAAILIMAKKGKADPATGEDPLAQFKKELGQPPADIAVVLSKAAASSGVPLNLLKAFAFVESRYRPLAVNSANPDNPSLGLFQIRPIPWLRYLNLGDNRNVLLNPATNAAAGAEIIHYFEDRGYKMPQQADVYNLGEPEYDAGRRNNDYRLKIETAFAWFQSQR